MEVDCEKLRRNLKHLRDQFNCVQMDPFLRLTKYTSADMDELVALLGQLIEDPKYTTEIGNRFQHILLLVVANAFGKDDYKTNEPNSESARDIHRTKCVALSKLIGCSPDVLRFSVHFFSRNSPPFGVNESLVYVPKQKQKKTSALVTDLELVQCCYRFLTADPVYFRSAWNWSDFFEQYSGKGCARQKYYCNRIMAAVACMTQCQLNRLDGEIAPEIIVQEQLRCDASSKDEMQIDVPAETGEKLRWNFKSDVVANVGDVLLPIFDAGNCNFFREQRREPDDLVIVDSTRLNVRSLALGVSSGRAICLSGPVGCGKTTLVEYVAKKTGRIAPKVQEMERKMETALKETNKKRKASKGANESDDMLDINLEQLKKAAPKNGFLRIQLGDQTDSKVLLGQYRCTDTPGEFIWQPGVLTQAVMNGYWLLLEDLDSATQDVCTVLTNLLENNYLSVPGFRDCLRIEPGFQLFLTLRTQKSGSIGHQNTYSLLEKYLYTVNVLPLSRAELCTIICANFPKLKTVASRIVDIYLTFSSGGHAIESDEIDESISILPKEKGHQQNGVEVEGEDSLPRFQYDNLSLNNLPNSGRLVSTRDLIKLCRRSDPSFSVTSTECAYFVFQNAVDIFCSHLPAGDAKRNMIVSIGGKIGINQSRCDHLYDDYKPSVDEAASSEIKIGRVTLKRGMRVGGGDEENDGTFIHKKMRLDKNASSKVRTQDFKLQSKAPTFSFTRPASCLLERIAVSVSQNEPILLVGETGVGKTSSIQYLSYQTHHKLVVVNMNNQSDVSDLIGGFKPVDLSYVITPLRYEFEHLFSKTFNAQKNEKFLINISICYNRGEYNVLVKLMLKISEKVFLRKRDEQLRSENVYAKWSALQQKLVKLDSQLKHSINVSFAFIPGSLVNCIRNGDWVLLDEINLASTETLECLSTILEPDGSIILLEKGDLVPVRRHPDFRIFACMNPSTDVGKKDLAVGIRNRFTEFFVDELVAENDLLVLVNDYLSSSGIQKVRILNTVKLYRRLRALSQLELNDGLGNKPVFTLRTLCRALMICSKNLCGTIERNLYESFCLSFLTQLDARSHKMVLSFIQKTLLHDAGQSTHPIPKPAQGEQLNFEGYWIEKGPKTIEECESYILTASVRNNLRDLARIISIGKLPVLLQGPTSAGKTSLIEYIAKRSGNVCLRINNHEHTDLQEYIGTYAAEVTGKLSFKEGVLVEAMRNGYWIILDELNLAPSDILEALNRVLDDNRELFIPETQVVVKAHPNFMLFATQNPPGLYGGRKMLSRAFKNRFIELHFSEIPRDELEVILEKRCLIPKSYSQKMVKVMSELQLNRRSTAKQNFTLRDLFRWGNRYTFADRKLLAKNSYDWNQHLIDEGYLVLSSKIRNLYETKIIQEALYTHFRKRISEDNLFSLHKDTSAVTQTILEQLVQQTAFRNIVWTFDMRRMAVLTAKALEFNEPVLLVGPTGCGKTTICQILAAIRGKKLRILNCHMHTEGADFIGGLRPFREENSSEKDAKQLFEWADGPLVLSMAEGGFFLADEISLAEDSVLERLNCVLEPERSLLLAEKGGVSADASEFVITAAEGFHFLATMNPGGDFGKKELSPALRNRLTEIWCRATDSIEDLIRIAEHSLRNGMNAKPEADPHKLAEVIVSIVFVLKKKIDKLNFSIRDVLAWAVFISKNQHLPLAESLIYGLETVFLDSLEMLPYETYEEILSLRKEVLAILHRLIATHLGIKQFNLKRSSEIQADDTAFGIAPFFININPEQRDRATEFMFSAPTTQKNLFRLLSALSLDKAILLEGPPGVGKTSLVENLARAAGYAIVRINLCEHTDLADLFGTDLPADTHSLELEPSDHQATTKLGSFVWRDGPLLAALKAKHTWILLDELNLAPQSVLEGLNAILDHRGEVFIAELNKTFKLGSKTRIFAAQNPLWQGGGRKGLPQSFLNRFTKVYLRKLERADLLHVIDGKYSQAFLDIGNGLIGDLGGKHGSDVSYFDAMSSDAEGSVDFDLSKRMVTFSETLETGITNLEFGYKGGPFEANLRDILRWCELLCSTQVGFFPKKFTKSSDTYRSFLLVLFEKMKLVYYQRMRTEVDKNYILTAFSRVFACDAFELEQQSQDIGVYWTDDKLYLGDLVLEKTERADEMNPIVQKTQKSSPLLLASQVGALKNVAECVLMEKPVILCGPSDCGKTKIIHLLTTLSNKFCNVDTIDDSVTGSFQQFDFNRHLEEVSTNVESIVMDAVKETVLCGGVKKIKLLVQLMSVWEKYSKLNDGKMALTTQSVQMEELELFHKRLEALRDVITTLIDQENIIHHHQKHLHSMAAVLAVLFNISKNADTLNTGGHFEWVDSKIVKSLKRGQYICLEHVNLCSSAILDRLNPIFEPNGSLLVSEKGVGGDGANESSELIRAHGNFRAFLTLDPKNGEISRAMRNRCIELALHREYLEDDLRKLVFENGVRDGWLVNAILAVHKVVRKVSEFNQFGIAHIVKFAYLVAQNQHMGLAETKCLLISAMEVYVRSSNTDLLGYGLQFYRNALKDVIQEEIKRAIPTPNLVNYENVLLKSDQLNSSQLIKLQAEPLLCVLRCHQNGHVDVVGALTNISDKFAEQSEIGLDNIKYMMYFLYEICSFEDLKYRELFLGEFLEAIKTTDEVKLKTELVTNGDGIAVDLELQPPLKGQWTEYRELQHTKREKQEVVEAPTITIEEMLRQLVQLNLVLPEIIRSSDSSEGSLPWNRSIFPRIREYKEENPVEQYRISALLLLNTILDRVVVEGTTKLSKIDLISYSKAVSSQIINDTLGNKLIAQLYGFLTTFNQIVRDALGKAFLNETDYTKLVGSYLWVNRLNDLSRRKLFHDKEVDIALVDYVTLHIKWIQKYTISILEKSHCQHIKTLSESLEESVQSSCHPLAAYRKKYVKNFLESLPFYTPDQIVNHQRMVHFNESIRLLPRLTRLYDYEEFLRRVTLINHPKTIDLRRRLSTDLGLVENVRFDHEKAAVDHDNVDFQQLVALVQQWKGAEIDDETEQCARTVALMDQYDSFVAGLQPTEEYATHKFEIEMLPLYEYFLLKSLVGGSSIINYDYVASTRSLDVDALGVLAHRNSPRYEQLMQMIGLISKLIRSEGGLEYLLKALPVFYKAITTYSNAQNRRNYEIRLNSLAIHHFVCYQNDTEESYEAHLDHVSNQSIHGALLTNNCLSILLAKNGDLRSTGLGELPEWRRTVRLLRNMLWANCGVLRREFDQQSVELGRAVDQATKLLAEFGFIQKVCKQAGEGKFVQDFELLADILGKVVKQSQDLVENMSYEDLCTSANRNLQWRFVSLIHTLRGMIELNLLVYLPLMDPVEKNALKKRYNDQDIKHYRTLIQVYDYMAITLNYKRLGESTKQLFAHHVSTLEEKRVKLSRKVALRPAENIYPELVRDVQNFLLSCCYPAKIAELVETAVRCLEFEIDVSNPVANCTQTKQFQLHSNETIKQIELWIAIAEKFEHHTMKRYETHYRDFWVPLSDAIVTTKYGLSGLKHCLLIKRDSIGLKSNGVFCDLAANDALSKIVGKFVQFPVVKPIQLFDEEATGHKVNVYTLLEKLDHCEDSYFRLLKSKLHEVKNSITALGCLEADEFVDLDKVMNICNQVWQKQELLRRKKQAENDSLYQTKSHCEEEDEEVTAQREIDGLFPNYVDEDFADFIQNDTLEQVIKVEKIKRNQKLIETVTSEDYTLICESFIYLMTRFSKSSYYNPQTVSDLPTLISPDYIGPFQTKVVIIQQLLQKYKTALNSTLDEGFYPGLSLLIGLVQNKYDDLELRRSTPTRYNFYKDSNISEIVQCVDVLKKVEDRVRLLLQEWPDHAVLKDIISILERIYAIPSTAPIVRFSTGLQLLRQKIDEWNSVAHRANNLRELEANIVEFVHRWMRMELQFWRECMSHTHETVRSKAYRYWFFMYNLLHEYLQSDSRAKLGNLLDYRKVERCFGEDELLEEEQPEEGTVKLEDLVHILKQFMESSNYAEFTTRLCILKSFEQYLVYLKFDDNRKKDTVIAVLYNLHMYYDQFSAEIEEHIKTKRTPIEKKLKEFVKIESFNKDLSYFSMRNNIARVHRQLHKFLKEFETELKEKILPVFSPKDPALEINHAEEQKGKNLRSECKITYYMVDVKHFIASPKLKQKFTTEKFPIGEDQSALELLVKIDRFFAVSRNVVKEAILHAPFPGLLHSLDTWAHDQIETIEYLRGLEVDRDQTKPKQKSQAKHILNQKRKALADFYKNLTQLGLSYRSGLVESAINSDPVDVQLKPFSVELLTQNSRYRKIDQHIVFLNDKLNLYFVKSVFKIKLLMKVMLQPNPDVGLINIDRIKGFAIDLFLLVQDQRRELGKSIANVRELRARIQDLTQLRACIESKSAQFNFERSRQKLKAIRKCTVHVGSVLEQFHLLLECAPADVPEDVQVLKGERGLTQSSMGPILKLSHECLKLSSKLSEELECDDENYIAGDFIDSVDRKFDCMSETLTMLANEMKIKNTDDYSVFARPIIVLMKTVKDCKRQCTLEKHMPLQSEQSDSNNLNKELEATIHSVLIAMQQIYKKHSTITAAEDKPSEGDSGDSPSLHSHHLKKKITDDLTHDLKTLNIRSVTTKVRSLLSAMEDSDDPSVSAAIIRKITRLVPILEQFNLLVEYYLIQQLGAHRISAKMLSVMLTVFIELGTKGFCIPKDLMEDEQEAGGQQEEGNQDGEKFGFEDGEGERDVSNKIESEDQLEDAKKPGQEENKNEEEKDNKEEKGIDMSEDFDSKLQDVDKPEGSDSEEEKDGDEEDLDKQMGDTEEGAEKLDDQIWGDDEDKEEEEKEDDMEEEDGKGSGETDETHNNLDSEKDKAPGEEEDGLDAIDKAADDNKKEKPKDIEDMNNQEGEEEQENPYHNQLEEPPQPEDLDLDEEFNLDNDNKPDNQKDEEENGENPFDIDTMKENAEQQNEEEEPKEDDTQNKAETPEQNDGDSSDEDQEEENPDGEDKLDENQDQQGEEEQPTPEEETPQIPDENKDPEVDQNPEIQEEDKKKKQEEDHHESKDKRTEEERVEAMPDNENKGTNDQVANDKPEAKQETDMDEQDTGEDKDGVGQAENDKSDSGHQGIAESKDTRTKRDRNDQKQKQEKRRQGNTDEDRSLGDPEKADKKRLKTVDEINREDRTEENNDEKQDPDAEEFQHVKDAKESDKTTLDTATEEQSKKVQHQENEKDEQQPNQEDEAAEELMETDEQPEQLDEVDKQLLDSEKNEKNKDKPAKKNEERREQVESLENVEVEGETVETSHVSRGSETTAHTIMDILNDMTLPEEPTTNEMLEMRKVVEKEMLATNSSQPAHDDFDSWQQISNKMLPNARELCEQLRLILEPTKCTRLKGDYRTGRRINMKKIIPYIASQFRKDKIWLRRTKAAQRDYKITIAVDDSKSMDHNNSKELTLQAISLVSQALTLLESGRLNVMSFGESPKILLKHSDQFDGAKLISSLNFDQNQSRIADLLDFLRAFNTEDSSSSENGLFENLLLVLSDGRNIHSEGEKKVKNSVKLARLQRIFIVYVIIDNPDNKHSVMDIRVPLFTADRSEIVMTSYLDVFPFPYYVIVRDLGQLPLVLSDAMRQWFELVNSDQ
ncbi:midasin [Toxorhynchites rutilus septentrionalis]|uniref:midasin n=1 Tax=Toxorhynchites rutilus septentrionalis TaxID=329112 RepID=UPI00247A6631|nr:midasin [Toxorhynchites rutilus septentrionalis]